MRQKRCRVVDREGAVEPASGDVRGFPGATHVVDQDVDPGEALEHLAGEAPDLRLGGQVRDQHIYATAASSVDLPSCVLGALLVAEA
jgi:hypothetical protein